MPLCWCPPRFFSRWSRALFIACVCVVQFPLCATAARLSHAVRYLFSGSSLHTMGCRPLVLLLTLFSFSCHFCAVFYHLHPRDLSLSAPQIRARSHAIRSLFTESTAHVAVLPDGCDTVAVERHHGTSEGRGKPIRFWSCSTCDGTVKNGYCCAVFVANLYSHCPVFKQINLLLYK